jgi:hypothetical protein
MDCVLDVADLYSQHDRRRLAPAFHIAVIEEALQLINGALRDAEGSPQVFPETELLAACGDALASVAELKQTMTHPV